MKLMKRSRGRRSGAASVELAVLLPFLIYLVMISVDWARLIYYTITINDCARAGAIYESDEELKAKLKPRYPDYIAAARAEAPEISPAPSVTRVFGKYDGNDAVYVTVSMPFRTITSIPGVPTTETIRRTVRMRISPQMTR